MRNKYIDTHKSLLSRIGEPSSGSYSDNGIKFKVGYCNENKTWHYDIETFCGRYHDGFGGYISAASAIHSMCISANTAVRVFLGDTRLQMRTVKKDLGMSFVLSLAKNEIGRFSLDDVNEKIQEKADKFCKNERL